MKIRWRDLLGLILLAPIGFRPAQGADGEHGPLTPTEALGTLHVPKGFEVRLAAHEPNVASPVAMAFDADGRMFVAEMRDYPIHAGSGSVRLLEDRDGDGVFEHATVFASALTYPSGVLPWRRGILVTAAQELLYLEDTDHDGRADIRRVLLTGFGKGNTQHLLNGLQHGIDNWIYGTPGLTGGHVRAPGAEPSVDLAGRDFRFRPDTGQLEAVTGGSQFGMTFDDWGRRFINVHDNHIVHPMLPASALNRNPWLITRSVQESISDHGNLPRVFGLSRPPFSFEPNSDSACGLTIDRSGALPPGFSGSAFSCQPARNLVHRDVIAARGPSFVAHRGEADSEFLASTDYWFRPVNLAFGPDGALYVADMYRAVIEHPEYIPKELLAKLDLRAGSDRGRIYRIALVGAPKRSAPPRLATASSTQLITELGNPNAWWRTTA